MDTLEPKGRFNCPCHGSIYDRYGKIIQGPAPRPMDLFGVTFRDGKVYIDTNPTKAKQRTVDTVKTDPVPPPA
jgi:Rieske Fe-S protein